VSNTDYIDYENLEVTDSYLDYAEPFLGKKPSREIRLIQRS